MNLHIPRLTLGLWMVLALAELSLAYPSLVMPRLHRSVDNEMGIENKNMGFPQTDDDVLQLEQLREIHEDDFSAPFSHQKKSDVMEAEEPQPLLVDDATIPELEQQLESVSAQILSTQGPPQPAPESAAEIPEVATGAGDQIKSSVGHRPPTLQSNDGGKAETTGEKPKAKCRLNGMHGAARLVYGQNPEVLPTTTTASTTPKSTTTTTTAPAPPSQSNEDSDEDSEQPAEPETPEDAKKETETETVDNPEAVDNGEAAEIANAENENQPAEVQITEAPEVPATTPVTQAPPPQLRPYKPVKATKKPNREEEPERQLIGDVIIDESALRKSTARRSVAHMTPKTAESLLRHGNGQYSSFDMAQYVFWTGDESGVAKAVEELIQQDMMTREDALKFLHEIRIGIEYLQKSYANRIFPEEIRHNTVKKSFIPKPSTTAATTTTSTTTTTTTAKPTLSYLNVEQNLEDPENMNLAKTLDSIALWHKLQSLNNQNKQDTTEYDNEIRRPKISDCEHKEYNLEEIIYKLARIMFTESLAHGDEAQREIQKLMDFFEREHELGVIPLDLEQKVIHVLLQALSDTLTEKPELWPAAQYPYSRLLRTYAHTTNYMRPSVTNV